MSADDKEIGLKPEPLEIGAAWPILPVGTVVPATMFGEPVVLVSSKPDGSPVIFCRGGWKWLERWKLTTIRVLGGRVRACGTGRNGGYRADRFLIDGDGNHLILQRNGNLFDLRRSNIASVSRGLLKQVRVEKNRGPDYGKDVTLRDGRRRSCRKPNSPSAVQRVTAIMDGS
ncbi:HNH endonuclease [Tardiphaga sp. OK246]|uniref:HNH endonuclease n=1 Tax=Tardiphaga sp. OK246 TaxID=1855307 RepID=UPI001FCD53E7|nr:HNH endonuclease [Tardiphaga sp. OK246]